MITKRDAEEILKILEKEYGEIKAMLDYKTPFQLMVAVVLSAQCTDERVNIVTKNLFNDVPDSKKMAYLSYEELENYIKSTGFYKNKAKNIIEASKILEKEHNGVIPDTMVELLKLPGVGRKSANVILGHIFGIPGVTVDTHVKRVSKRLGFTNANTRLF